MATIRQYSGDYIEPALCVLWPATATRLVARLVPEFLPLRVLFCGAVIIVAACRARVDQVAELFCWRPYEVKLDDRSWNTFLDFLDGDRPKPRTIFIFDACL